MNFTKYDMERFLKSNLLNIVVTFFSLLSLQLTVMSQGHAAHDHDRYDDRANDITQDHISHDDDIESDHTAHADHDESETIHFTEQQIEDFKIVIKEADLAELTLETILPGEIKLNREAMAHVSPRYDGVVTKIMARLGDEVKAGQTLATLESNSTLAPFDVTSPIDGTIVEFHITLGESVDAGRYLFIVANLSTVWADLDIYQKDLARINKGQTVIVKAGNDEHGTEGVIEYVGPVVNEETRTGLARITLTNPDRNWKPGMFVTAYVTTDTIFVPVAVERSALQTHEGQTLVYVRTMEGFDPRPVMVGQKDSRLVEILSGVELGEFYVTQRSFIIKAHKEKASIDPHAGHNH